MSQQLKQRMKDILKALNENIHEREEVFAVSLLSALADQNIFLYGPPGTAKSLISRRLAKVFKSKNYFEYLMQKFSTPEEVFGPISLTELKKDNYVRKTDGYLPTTEFAFLDEIWKSSPAILNTLLTALNEKKFRNGNQLLNLPLKVVVSASNETPPKGQGLEALYDRFLTRLYVPPMENKNNFEILLQSGGTSDDINIDENLLITNDEWEQWKKESNDVKLSKETLNIINDVRLRIEEKNRSKELDVYVSDRRWQKASTLLKVSAYFCDREETNIIDCLLLSHCLWSTKDNKNEIINIVEDAVRNSGFDTEHNLIDFDLEKNDLEYEINEELLHSTDVYKTERLIDGNKYFKITNKYKENSKSITYLLSFDKMKTTDTFHPIDTNGNELNWIDCNFDNQGTCKINICDDHDNARPYTNIIFTPEVKFFKGDQKESVNPRLIEQLKNATFNLKEKVKKILNPIEIKKNEFLKELDTPFILDTKINIAIESVNKQIEDLKLRYKDCERLESLVG
jgi:MoxR-like ATPase